MYRGIKAQDLGEELERIRTKNGGRLEPEMVVDDARDPLSVLHSAFTWDDGKAAEEYRKWEGRQIIRAVVAVGPGAAVNQPAFVHVEVNGQQYYQNAAVLSDQEYKSALTEGKRRLRAAQASFDELKALAHASQLPLVSATLDAIRTAQESAAQIA